MTAIQLHDRPCVDENDIQAITQFLLDTHTLTKTLHNWEPRRWQGTVYHRDDRDFAEYQAHLPENVHIWERDNQIIGVVIPEYDGGAFFQIHPAHRIIESLMLDWAETHLAQTNDKGQKWLQVWSQEHADHRNNLLRQRGYEQTPDHEIILCRRMNAPILDVNLAQGYTVRAMRRQPDDWEQMATLLNRAFNRNLHVAEEIRNFQNSPYYQLDFDIVIESPDKVLVANAGFMVHEQESFGVVEPVCTHPDHQGKGLARVAIMEGLKRIRPLKIERLYIGVWYQNPTAIHVYNKMGFNDPTNVYKWHRMW